MQKTHNKAGNKLQTSVEFITTYGFAILIIAIVLGAIYLFVLAPQKTTPSSCTFSPGTYCNDLLVTSNSQGLHAIILLTNSQQYPLLNPSISINASQYSANGLCSPNYVAPGGAIFCNVTLTTLSTTPAGSPIAGSVYLTGTSCPGKIASACTSSPKQTYAGSFNTHTELASTSTPQIVISVQNSTQYSNGVPDKITASMNYFGYALAGATINFTLHSQTSGLNAALAPKMATTNANGTAQSFVSAINTGTATIMASFGSYNALINVSFVYPPTAYSTTTINSPGGGTTTTVCVVDCNAPTTSTTSTTTTSSTTTTVSSYAAFQIYCYYFGYADNGESGMPSRPLGCFNSLGETVDELQLNQTSGPGFALAGIVVECAGAVTYTGCNNVAYFFEESSLGTGTACSSAPSPTSADYLGWLVKSDNSCLAGVTENTNFAFKTGSINVGATYPGPSGMAWYPAGPNGGQDGSIPVPSAPSSNTLSTSTGYICLQGTQTGSTEPPNYQCPGTTINDPNGQDTAHWWVEEFISSSSGQSGYLGPVCGNAWKEYVGTPFYSSLYGSQANKEGVESDDCVYPTTTSTTATTTTSTSTVKTLSTTCPKSGCLQTKRLNIPARSGR